MLTIVPIILGVLDSYKTYLAAAGLVALALFQVHAGRFEPAVQSALSALVAIGLRNELAKTLA